MKRFKEYLEDVQVDLKKSKVDEKTILVIIDGKLFDKYNANDNLQKLINDYNKANPGATIDTTHGAKPGDTLGNLVFRDDNRVEFSKVLKELKTGEKKAISQLRYLKK